MKTLVQKLAIACHPRVVWSWWKIWGTFPVFSWVIAAHYFRLGDFRTAAQHYESGLRRHPHNVAAECASLDFAYCLYRLGDLKRSARLLQSLARKERPLRDGLLLLAKIQLALGYGENAVQTMSRCARHYGEEVQIIAAYAHILLAAKRPAGQIIAMKKVLQERREKLPLQDSKLIYLDAALAEIELRTADKELGEQMVARVLSTGNAPFEMYLVRGESFFETGRIQQAREQFEHASQISPQDPRPFLLLAKTYLLPGSFFEPRWAEQLAIAACRASCWLNPAALAVLVDVYEAIGDRETGSLYLARYKKLTSMRELSSTQRRQGEAETRIERLRSISSSSSSRS